MKKVSLDKVIYVITIIIGALFIYVGHNVASSNVQVPQNAQQFEIEKAEVISVSDDGNQTEFGFFFVDKKDEARHTATQDSTGTSVKVKEGDTVYVTKNSEDSEKYIFYDYLRIDKLIILVAVFLVMVVAFARVKGINTVISLAFTLLSLFYVFLPAILSQYNVYLWGIVCCIAIVVFTLIIVHGFNKKSLASGIGTILGLGFAWLIMHISSGFFNFTGLTSEEAMYLSFNNYNMEFDVKAIFFTTILIGALGAVMDVAMSISSSLYEFKQVKPDITIKEMIQSGFEIGKDILGTMTNTLILAYVGSGFLTIIVIVGFNTDLISIFNKEFLIAQIFEPLIGSFGIVATLPITSVVCAYLFKFFDNRKHNDVGSVRVEESEYITPKIMIKQRKRNRKLHIKNYDE